MNTTWFLVPPVAFTLILVISVLMSALSSRLAFKNPRHAPGKGKAYACGEDVPCPNLQPDYGQFFPFAFFFTIMHVAALMLATAPAFAIRASGIVFLYILAALMGLLILFRKERS